MENYIEINKASWNARLEAHLQSDFYEMEAFQQGKSSLNEIELALLGDIKGKKVLHLQCHFGQDTISLSRLGAEVTGVDLSDLAIERAKTLAKENQSTAKFVCCNIYDLEKYLDETFDIVFTSYGTISWLPDLSKWAAIISKYLKPNGQFIFAEFHPAVWMFDDNFEKVIYHYNNIEAIIEEEEGTYADKNAAIKQKCICWNHGIGEVVNSLLSSDLRLDDLQEYDYSPYPFVQHTEKIGDKKYQIINFGNKMPLVYSIKATKSA
jgi:SAM-dependent methyltransferase